jgi:hypothetical protein
VHVKFTDDDAEIPEPVRRKHALAETKLVLTKASAAYRPWSCPSTAECCQLTKTGRPPWLWPSEWEVLLERLKLLLGKVRERLLAQLRGIDLAELLAQGFATPFVLKIDDARWF